MLRIRTIFTALSTVLLTVAMWACSSDGCLENRSSLPLVGFYAGGNGEKISLDSLQITGIGIKGDAPLSQPGEPISEIYLPMRSTMESVSWQFAYKWQRLAGGTLADTITLAYTSEPYFASEECGVIYKYRITRLNYTRHLIDSIAVTDSLVTNTDLERLQIYFRTDE